MPAPSASRNGREEKRLRIEDVGSRIADNVLAITRVKIRMRNVQRLLKTQNPRIGEVNVDDLIDNRYIRKLDESGFFDRIYGNKESPTWFPVRILLFAGCGSGRLSRLLCLTLRA